MQPDWWFDEVAHAGAEHVDPDRVATYDEKVAFDPSEEVDRLTSLGLGPDDTLVDFGAGTGTLALAAARRCGRVVAVDVSKPMLDRARAKADGVGVDNVEFVHGGITAYDHQGPPAAFAFSKNTLHHLPDFWKVEALKTIAETLAPGGIFRFRDLVFSFDPAESVDAIEDWLAGFEGTAFTQEELHRHCREEFSTYGFLQERMLEAVGFEVQEATYRQGFYAAYTCRKPRDEHLVGNR